MAEEKASKTDIFAEKVITAAGEFPAYPQHVYEETNETYPDGSKKTKLLGIAKNPDEHKKMLAGQKAWGNKQ